MKNKLAGIVALLITLSSVNALACRPPDYDLYAQKSLQVISHRNILKLFGRSQAIETIKRSGHNIWILSSKKCELELRIDFTRPNPELPCGGPFVEEIEIISERVCR